MIFNDLGTAYAIEDRLIKKLDFFCNMVTRKNQKQDVVLIVHGGTGEGKTNTSCVIARYCHNKINRPVHFFFRLEPLIDFAKSTENKIIIWDEPSLDSLSTDQMTALNKDLMRLLNTMRKKRHILIVNLTKFWRFPEGLVVDRALGLIHMHSKNGTDMGRFLYIRKNKLEALWNSYRTSHKRLYGKLKSFGGRFPEITERIADDGSRCFDKLDFTINDKAHATYEDYDRLKDEAIESIGGKVGGMSKREIKLKTSIDDLQLGLVKVIDYFGLEKGKVAALLGKDRSTIHDWSKKGQINPYTPQKQGFGVVGQPSNSILLASGQENQLIATENGQHLIN